MMTTPEFQPAPQHGGPASRVSGYDALSAARQRLEEALVAPGLSREWARGVDEGLAALAEALRRHVEVSEAPGGPLDQAVRARHGLQKAAGALRAEHPLLLAELDALRAEVVALPSGRAVDVEAVRQRAGALQDTVRRHIARGADLLHEAFLRDEGGQG